MNSKYLKQDLKHFFVNLGITLVILVVYAKFGFLGWPHLLSVIFIHYSVLPLDDWLEKERPFPYYVLPMVAYAAYYFPIITVFALLGDVVVNLRTLTNKNNFALERLEGLGNIPIYVLPLLIPAGLNNPKLYLISSLFILFTDSFHKIGHRETVNKKLMWISGLMLFFLVALLFRTPTITFYALLIATLISLIPFKLIKSNLNSWIYSQAWFGFAAFVGFYYYLYFVI